MRVCCLLVALAACASCAASPQRIKMDLDSSWRFQRKPEDARPRHSDNCSVPECMPSMDDSGWRLVDVPHDFVVEGNFTNSSSQFDWTHAYLPFGTAWYRKHFVVPASARAFSKWLDFDGVMVASHVYLNGKLLGNHSNGYTPFRFFLDELNYGGDNVIAVFVDASEEATKKQVSWYYDGGGIYRHVSFTMAPLVHVAPWGVYAPALVTGPVQQSTADAALRPTVDVANKGAGNATVNVSTLVLDAHGLVTGRASVLVTVAAGATETVAVPSIPMASASLWSPEHPALYTLQTTLTLGGRLVDSVDTVFGVREALFDANKGLLLNGQPTKVLGACNHQDFAGLGSAVPDSLQAHRVQKLKDLGFNAWRTAHNPPTEALLDEADRLGMVVWDESHQLTMPEEIATLVRRDRNHPSVFFWSLCNEGSCMTGSWNHTNDNIRADRKTIATFDPLMKRAVVGNPNGCGSAEGALELDLLTFDYCSSYDQWHTKFPDMAVIVAEMGSATYDRGETHDDVKAGHVSTFRGNLEGPWKSILQRDFVVGGFLWTGWDYKGEPVPTHWPAVNSHFGALDIAGFEKDWAYWYKAWFGRPDPPLLHLFPHWNWGNASNISAPHLARCEGLCSANDTAQPQVSVYAISNVPGGGVELLLNGRSMGTRNVSEYGHVQWQVPFEPGKLTARAYKHGASVPSASASVRTTGPAVALRAAIKDGVGAAGLGKGDVGLVRVEVVDAEGSVVPMAADVITFKVLGSGKLLGTGNGDPASNTPDKSAAREAFHGLVLGVVQGAGGKFVVSVSAPGLAGASVLFDPLPGALQEVVFA